MAVTTGFFTREEAKRGQAAKPKASGLSEEQLYELGERGVDHMNPDAKTVHMKPYGPKHPTVLVLGEAPGQMEDDQGRPFVGPSGKLLRRYLSEDVPVQFDNTCRTFPPVRRGSRTPTPHEVACYRKAVSDNIGRSKPKAVLATGAIPSNWFLGGGYTMDSLRGRRFPCKIGEHPFWVYPVHHPSYVLRVENMQGEKGKAPGAEVRRFFGLDVERCFAEAGTIEPPDVVAPEDAFTGCETTQGGPGEVDRVKSFLKSLLHEPSIGLDLETNRKRPYYPGAKILTISFGTRERTLAFPVDHPQALWSPDDKVRLRKVVRWFLRAHAGRKTSHNWAFDMEWLVWWLGMDLLELLGQNCSMAQSYILDERQGGHSLDFLCLLYFGLSLKKLSKGTKAGGFFGVDDAKIDRAKLEFTNLADVLLYNAGDSKWHHAVYLRQRKLLKREGLSATYEEHVDRVPSIVLAQARGIAVNPDEVAALQGDLVAKIKAAKKVIDENPVVRKVVENVGVFNPNSTPQLTKVFRDMLHRKEGEQRGGKYSTKESVLAQMKDEPLAKAILDLREVTKLKGTYVDKMDPKASNATIYPDGLLHPQAKHTSTDSGRLSWIDPSVQNQPSREHPQIRAMIAGLTKDILRKFGIDPASRWDYYGDEVILEADYGQHEARVIAMHSKDEFLVKALWEDYDIHQDWTERIAKASNKVWLEHGKDFKKLRSKVKNRWTFPAFFKSALPPIARNFGVEPRVFRPLFDDFWDRHSGVKAWQDRMIKSYREKGYTEGLTGRRRHGPLSDEMIVNSAVQGDASDIKAHGWNAARRRALETGNLWLAPVLEVHDSLLLRVPKTKVGFAAESLVRAMCSVSWKWLNVPIAVELSVGPNWYEKRPLGTVRSDKVEEGLRVLKL